MKRFLAMALALTMALSLTACGGGTPNTNNAPGSGSAGSGSPSGSSSPSGAADITQGDKLNIKWYAVLPDNHPTITAYAALFDEIKEETNGRITFTMTAFPTCWAPSRRAST